MIDIILRIIMGICAIALGFFVIGVCIILLTVVTAHFNIVCVIISTIVVFIVAYVIGNSMLSKL